ncbi:MAG: hypothetical protein VW600_21020, partial [Ferrovibrio sp.]
MTSTTLPRKASSVTVWSFGSRKSAVAAGFRSAERVNFRISPVRGSSDAITGPASTQTVARIVRNRFIAEAIPIMSAKKKSSKSPNKTKQANSMWGGRFAAGPAAIMTEINASIRFDQKLYRQDIRGSQAHCRMLVRQGLISAAEGKTIQAGLETILREIEAGKFRIDPALE